MIVKDLRAAVRKAGGSLEREGAGRWEVYQCEAPTGKVWAAASTHDMKVEWLKGDSVYRDEAITDAVERLSLGLVDCDDEDCERCGS